MKSIVIALGGNALLSPSGKQEFSKESINAGNTAKSIISLYKSEKCRMAITHGNGSQVGDELMRNEHAKLQVPKMPLYILNAETQASIGTVLESAMRNSISQSKIKANVCVVLSHVLVDVKDPAFKRPTKQVGPFYTKRELEKELKLDKFAYIKKGSKYRQVVPSPKPTSILEIETIKNAQKGNFVIACGGGGIATIKKNGRFTSTNAIIDKDLTSQILATSLKADTLIILTNVDYVYEKYGKRNTAIKSIKAKELRKKLGAFEEGTMKPKIEACVKFIENGGRTAYIGNLSKLDLILKRKSGTMIN